MKIHVAHALCRSKEKLTSREGDPRVVEFNHDASTSLKRSLRVWLLLSWRSD